MLFNLIMQVQKSKIASFYWLNRRSSADCLAVICKTKEPSSRAGSDMDFYGFFQLLLESLSVTCLLAGAQNVRFCRVFADCLSVVSLLAERFNSVDLSQLSRLFL